MYLCPAGDFMNMLPELLFFMVICVYFLAGTWFISRPGKKK